jgi:CHAT domain
MMWLELELSTAEDEVRVSPRGSGGQRPPAHTMAAEQGIDALETFSSKVARAVRAGKPLDPAALARAQALHHALIKDKVRDLLVELRAAARPDPVLVRLFAQGPELRAVPWEALCEPETDRGFLGTDAELLFARGVDSAKPWEPREVKGAVRVLAIAPGSGAYALTTLHQALGDAIGAGEVEWLDPIAGPDVSAQVLFDRLRRGKAPHVVHWLGHGGLDASSRPVLRLADDPDADPEERWVLAEDIARELSASFRYDLRLVVLEACEGAKVGALGSAAELFARAGADAVVAHLWPVKTDTARACSSALYRALTRATAGRGDIGKSVAAARRTLLVESQSAEAFSPVLFLRGQDTVLFDFTGRRVQKPAPKTGKLTLAPALETVLGAPFTLVLGDLDEDRGALRQRIEQVMAESGETVPPGLSLSTLTQRYVLLRADGRDELDRQFQRALKSIAQTEAPPLVDALARFVAPGVHLTLLWAPFLERALAKKHPDRILYAIQPGPSARAAPTVVKRAANAADKAKWTLEPKLPTRFDLAKDIVVLRLHGGYSAEPDPILSKPAVTEDDHLQGIGSVSTPVWMQELLAHPRIRPALFVGLSVREWRHRMLLKWLYNERPAPQGSVALLPPSADPSADPREPAMWNSGGGLPGSSSIAAVQEDAAALASLLDAYTPGGGP